MHCHGLACTAVHTENMLSKYAAVRKRRCAGQSDHCHRAASATQLRGDASPRGRLKNRARASAVRFLRSETPLICLTILMNRNTPIAYIIQRWVVKSSARFLPVQARHNDKLRPRATDQLRGSPCAPELKKPAGRWTRCIAQGRRRRFRSDVCAPLGAPAALRPKTRPRRKMPRSAVAALVCAAP